MASREASPKGARATALLAAALAIGWMAAVQAAQEAPETPSEEYPTDGLSDEERAGLEAADPETVVIKAKRLTATDQTTAFGETLEIGEAAGQVETVSDVLSSAVGIQVRRLGGLGAYGAASIRGSTSSQVPIYLDGVLLNAGGFASVDLGDLSLDSLARIEVYRGSTPAGLGIAGMGGALHLRTRQFEGGLTELAVGAGSFNSLRLFALRKDRFELADSKLLLAVSLERSSGDFDYLNRNGTSDNPDDDRIQPRANNAHRAASGLAKLDAGLGAWRLTLAEDVFVKQQGLAGIDSVPTAQTDLGTLRSALSLRAERRLDTGLKLALDASHLYLREDFDDSHTPHGELGIGRQHGLASTHAVAAGGRIEWLVAQGHLSTTRLQSRWERYSNRDLLAHVQAGDKDRLSLAAAAQHEWNPVGDLFLLPAARLEYQHGAFAGGPLPVGLGESEATRSDDLFWQASLGLRWEVLAGLEIKANGGRYYRSPDLAELFGDRGLVVANPNLEPEVGYNADAGLVWLVDKRGLLDGLRLEAAWFGTWSDDLIVTVQNSQNTVRSENVGAAEILGLETSLRLDLFGLLSLAANYTYLHATNQSNTTYLRGKRLPGRPVHEAYAKLALFHRAPRWEARLWVDGDYAGRNYLDQVNLKQDALARLLFGAGFTLAHSPTGLSLSVQVKNLMDTIVIEDGAGRRHPLRDFEGFPLPGRTVMASLRWRA